LSYIYQQNKQQHFSTQIPEIKYSGFRVSICLNFMSYRVKLNSEAAYQLADAMQQTADKKRSRRLLAISLRHYGYPVHEIAKLLNVSEKTVTSWIRKYLGSGLDGLLELQYPRKKNSRLAPYETAIREFRAQFPDATREALHTWLADSQGVEIDYSWLCRYLDRHGL
jgi:transposase